MREMRHRNRRFERALEQQERHARREHEGGGMIRIHKYELAVLPEQVLQLAVVRWLGVGWQGDHPVVWVEELAGDEAQRWPHVIALRMTGEAPPEGDQQRGRVEHLGTVQTMVGGSPFVVHLYHVP